jgi:hypothetical protein
MKSLSPGIFLLQILRTILTPVWAFTFFFLFMEKLIDRSDDGRLVTRTVSDGRDWYRVKYQTVEFSKQSERYVKDEVSFVQAWDVDEALRVLKEVLKVEWQENEATIDGKYNDPIIVSVQKSDADCFVNKVVDQWKVSHCGLPNEETRQEGSKRAAMEDVMKALGWNNKEGYTPSVYSDNGDTFTFVDKGNPGCLWEVSIRGPL